MMDETRPRERGSIEETAQNSSGRWEKYKRSKRTNFQCRRAETPRTDNKAFAVRLRGQMCDWLAFSSVWSADRK